jgi:hypothetical protein
VLDTVVDHKHDANPKHNVNGNVNSSVNGNVNGEGLCEDQWRISNVLYLSAQHNVNAPLASGAGGDGGDGRDGACGGIHLDAQLLQQLLYVRQLCRRAGVCSVVHAGALHARVRIARWTITSAAQRRQAEGIWCRQRWRRAALTGTESSTCIRNASAYNTCSNAVACEHPGWCLDLWLRCPVCAQHALHRTHTLQRCIHSQLLVH